MVLIRLVNGIADREQTTLFAKSVRELAKSLHLPIAFVEARHQATHNSLPPLSLLLDLRLQALDWLHQRYWLPEHHNHQQQHRDVVTCSGLADHLLDHLLRCPRSGTPFTPASTILVFNSLFTKWSNQLNDLFSQHPSLPAALSLRLLSLISTRDSSWHHQWRQALAASWVPSCINRLPKRQAINLLMEQSPSPFIAELVNQYHSTHDHDRVIADRSKSSLAAELLHIFHNDDKSPSSPRTLLSEIERWTDLNRSRWRRAYRHGVHIPIGLLPDASAPDLRCSTPLVFGKNVNLSPSPISSPKRPRSEQALLSDMIAPLL